jgi:hypothetical protein
MHLQKIYLNPLLPVIAADDNRCLEAIVIKKLEAELEGFLGIVLQDPFKATQAGNGTFFEDGCYL